MRRRVIRGTLQVAFAVGALAVFFWQVDTGEVFVQLRQVDLRWAVFALLAFTASKVLHSWRWWQFLGRPETPIPPLVGVFLVSNMANSLLPLRAGDFLRVEVPAKRFGIPRSLLASSVFVVESVLDLFAFAILMVVALLLSDLPVVLRPLIGLVGGSAVVLFGAIVVLARSRDAIEGWLGRALDALPSRISRPITSRLPDFVDGMSSLRTNMDAARVVGISLVAWIVEVGVYFLLAKAFGLDLDAPQALILMIAANLIVSLPITPWSIGPYELAVTEALVALGADRTTAGAFALGSHLMLQVWIVLTGILAMLWIGLGPRDLWPGSREARDTLRSEAGRGSGSRPESQEAARASDSQPPP